MTDSPPTDRNGNGPGVPLESARGRWILVATVLGSAVTMITGTVVNVALPAMGRELDAGTVAVQWILNGYLLAVASLILVGGALGDRFGRRRVFVVGALLFAATSLACARAPDVWWLVGFRILQGGAAALLTPGSLAILQSTLRPRDRGRAIGAWSALGGVAAAVGPVLGGWLVDTGSWRWVFYLNIPLALAVMVVARRWVPETRNPAASRLDLAGSAAAFLALGGLSGALVVGPEWGVLSPGTVALGGGGLVAFAAFLATEARSRAPMMPLEMFARGPFAAANAVTFVVYAALGGVFFFLVVFLQTGLGYSALEAGASLLPITLLMLLLSSSAGDLAQRKGARRPLTVGAGTIAAGMVLMSFLGPDDSYLTGVLPAVVVFGLGLAATVAPVTSAALAAVDPHRTGVASGVNNAVSRTAQLGAVAVVPWLAGLEGGEINQADPLLEGFPRAMRVMAGVALAGAALAWAALTDDPLDRESAAPAKRVTEPGEAEVRESRRRSPTHCAVDGTPLTAEGEGPAPGPAGPRG